MKKKAYIDLGKDRRSYIGCTLLALLATMISASLSLLTGLQFGQSIFEKAGMAAGGVLAVLGAHFLLALCRPASVWMRFVAGLLWLFCIVYVVYSHSNFFLLSQQQAGMHRVAFSDQVLLQSEPKRSLTTILSDQAIIKTELVGQSQYDCRIGCFRSKTKMTRLKGELEVLNAEAEEVKRWQVQQDRQEGRSDSLRDDPVTMRLAQLLGVTDAQIGLVMSLLFSAILEGLACCCWYVALQFRDATSNQSVVEIVTSVPKTVMNTPDIVTEVLASDKPVLALNAVDIRDAALPSESDLKVIELINEFKAGRLELTVKAVRKYCHCSQTKAAEFRRLMAASLDNETQTC